MTDVIRNEIRKGFYLDSVALMRMSREIAGMDGVHEAALMMGSPSNIEIMQAAGLISGSCDARSNDLVLALRASSDDVADTAFELAYGLLDKPKSGGDGADQSWRPRSIAAAVKDRPEANLALISVNGDFAAAEARKAMRRGLNVLMFSDNVPIQDEISLKEEARDLGVLMMGPDCGTAIINGAPLGFANVVNRGAIGIIGASGTGTQEVTALVSQSGKGISHAIGVGGRDLKQDVGGITTLMAMDLLEKDQQTESVVLVSKPPHPSVAARIVERIAQSDKSYIVCFLGAESLDLPVNAQQADTLHAAASLALGANAAAVDFDPAASAAKAGKRGAGEIRGLFCGGTLCAEAQVILRQGGRKVQSNAAIPGVPSIGGAEAQGDWLIDLGADEYTVGRAHPMIDPSLRDEMVREALTDQAVAVILIDLVIGYGAHSDPAAVLIDVLSRQSERSALIVASVTGTDDDPQVRSRQIKSLESAGVLVAPSNALACKLALALVE